METLEALAREWFDAVAARDFDALSNLYATDAEYIRSDGYSKGRDAILSYLRSVAAAFPDEEATVEAVLVSDGGVTVEWTESATHTEPYKTEHFGVLEPTHKGYRNLRVVDIFRFSDGKITSQHEYYDLLSLMGQLGWLERFTKMTAPA